MSDLRDKDLKTTILKLLKELKEDVDKDRKTKYEQNENINKKTEILKRNQNENPELKYSYNNWNEKYTIQLKNRFKEAEEWISKLENRTIIRERREEWIKNMLQLHAVL